MTRPTGEDKSTFSDLYSHPQLMVANKEREVVFTYRREIDNKGLERFLKKAKERMKAFISSEMCPNNR